MDITAPLEPLYFSVQLDDGVTGQTSETTDREVAETKFAAWVKKYPDQRVTLCQVWISEIKAHNPVKAA